MRIGVLALQGAFIEHIHKLQALGIDTFEIRQPADLQTTCDGLIIPGGESTVIGKLLVELQLLTPLKNAIQAGLPVLGTCAGLILLAKTISNATQPGINTMDIVTTRNGYGRQLGSFNTVATFAGEKIPMVFIRAPYIQKVGPQVEVLGQVEGRIIAARQANMLATAFHPELTDDPKVYQYFITMINQQNQRRVV
ncbi:SNO family glutamine amidotransferase [Agrilactobacillus composti DSM 18527 = JCM 14202]|uniref:Pyridoxal 5'-phosphate synthase subunit PdxT n=1 Tax=Agrilactobacillus composti DSM 18527 = JCM 14202 TaxID=1423734 RepID=X0QSB8_9LACO|nr:pyridoxal 5'-phosphate synthase glutaminase subunit PdxT [Agrilactobacillus composti]KRM33522.1 SNO family glutamine amidotransferase [Agrilactobacillus composti DSM 18527 = JCM 14202]GAF41475.1 pyridoxine biosynthesis glutamine amidotransferase, glutaminase subunit [Agrilactobacillus composti DSM 18527 = JCM 14202]